jgi:hypothetical protein
MNSKSRSRQWLPNSGSDCDSLLGNERGRVQISWGNERGRGETNGDAYRFRGEPSTAGEERDNHKLIDI